MDATPATKLRYPWQICFIIAMEACERFSFYGMNAILTLYLVYLFKDKQGMKESDAEDLATELFHLFKFLSYFTPLFGAALADSVMGKFRTIFILSLVYAAGQIVLTIGAISNTEQGLPNMPNTAVSFVGILLIAIGTGGIKPCVVALGADQFQVPEQRSQMATYFAMFYASINFGSLISTVATPLLRKEPCFGEDTCFSLAFGVPAALMVIALVVFFCGKFLYKVNIPERNILVESCQCIVYAIKNRKAKPKKGHWLEAAAPKYDSEFISNLQAVFRVGTLFLLYPMYWGLYEQQGSRWTIQATRMNGDTFGWIILPDQMQVANPILILILIPVFDKGVYPLLNKFKILRTPLQKIVTGCALVALAFVMSGILELQLEKTYPDLPESGETHLTLHNGLETQLQWTGESAKMFGENLPAGETFVGKIPSSISEISYLGNNGEQKTSRLNLADTEGKSYDFLIRLDGAELIFFRSSNPNIQEKSSDSYPNVRFLTDLTDRSCNLITVSDGKTSVPIATYPRFDSNGTTLAELGSQTVTLHCGERKEDYEIEAQMGGSYNFYLYNKKIRSAEVTPHNRVHIFWLLPQYVTLTVGEILFSITSLEFSYSQAPPSMKSIMTALFYLTNAFGNLLTLLIILIVSAIGLSQWIEFFLFAGLLAVFTFLLAIASMRYTYVDYTEGNTVNTTTTTDNSSQDKLETKGD